MRGFNAVFCLMVAAGLVSGPGHAAERARDDEGGFFAQIAARGGDYRDQRLIAIEPPKLEKRVLPVAAGAAAAAFEPAEKITTAEQLRKELEQQRAAHAPYLADRAPAVPETRIGVPLESFDWRIETEDDRRDFAGTVAGKGSWERVKIPHYGPPMGTAVTYYRTQFDVTQQMLDHGALFVHFKGVDYKAHVFVNGGFLGSHEGVFAPFEFEFTPQARLGKNVLVVKVCNDFTGLGNHPQLGFEMGNKTYGAKLYAAVGPGWNEPVVGWHHLPARHGHLSGRDDRSPTTDADS